MSFPLSSVCPLWSYRRTVSLKEFSSLPPILTFCSSLFSFPPYNLPTISSLFCYFFFIFPCSARCLYSIFVQFCGLLLCTLMYICLVLYTYLYAFHFFLLCSSSLFQCFALQIILVLKCLSDSFSPVPNTFAIASLLHCSSSLQHNTLCTLLFLLYSPLPSFTLSPSLTSFPCLQSEYLISLCSVATSSLSTSSPISFQFFFCPHHQHNIICICQHMHFNLPIIIPSFCILAHFCTKSALYRANSEGLNG